MSAEPLTLRCRCCDRVMSFASSEEAFRAGWDEPTHLPSWPVTCPACPACPGTLINDHQPAHAEAVWAAESAAYCAEKKQRAREKLAVTPHVSKEEYMTSDLAKLAVDVARQFWMSHSLRRQERSSRNACARPKRATVTEWIAQYECFAKSALPVEHPKAVDRRVGHAFTVRDT